MPRINLLSTVCAFLVMATLASCYEKVEGCLDIEANNFAFGADQPCDSCCTYPNLELEFVHQFQIVGDTGTIGNFDLNTPFRLVSDTNHWFSVEGFRFLLSDARLVDLTGNEVSTVDTLVVQTPYDTRIIANRFALVDDGIVGIRQLPLFRGSARVNALRLQFGMNDTLRFIRPESVVRSNHPLNLTQSDSLHYSVSSGYLGVSGRIQADTAAAQILAIGLFEPLELELPFDTDLVITDGFSPRIRIGIDYSTLFEGIDFSFDNSTTIETQIRNNFVRSFTVLQTSVSEN